MKRLRLLGLLLLVSPTHATPLAGAPLSVTPTTDCNKTVCRPALLIQGGFDRRGALLPAFKAALSQARFPPKVVIFDSFGGNVSDAINLGHFLRKQRLDTHLRQGDDCQSACLYAFIGGINRTISEGSYLGVHQHKSMGEENTAKISQLLVRDILIDLMLSQVDRDVLVFVLSNDKVYELSTECSRALNIDNTTPAREPKKSCGEVVLLNQ